MFAVIKLYLPYTRRHVYRVKIYGCTECLCTVCVWGFLGQFFKSFYLSFVCLCVRENTRKRVIAFG